MNKSKTGRLMYRSYIPPHPDTLPGTPPGYRELIVTQRPREGLYKERIAMLDLCPTDLTPGKKKRHMELEKNALLAKRKFELLKRTTGK